MGLFSVGERVCNNCVYWQCHSERKVRGNPPSEIYTTSNCDRCSVSKRNTLSKNSCERFHHICGYNSYYTPPQINVESPSSGEMLLTSVVNYIRESRAIDMARELINSTSTNFKSAGTKSSKLQKLQRYGLSKTASAYEQEAFEVLLEGAMSNEPETQLYLAHCFQHGEYGAVKNPKLAAKWCLKSACHNNADAQNLLGTFYIDGFGVEKDLRKACALFRSATKLGSREAAVNLKAITKNCIGGY